MRPSELGQDASPSVDFDPDVALPADVFAVEWAVASQAPDDPPPAPERWRNEAVAASFDR